MQKYRVLQLMIIGAGNMYSPDVDLGAQPVNPASFARSDTQSEIGGTFAQVDESSGDNADSNTTSNRKASCLEKAKVANQCMRDIFYPKTCSRLSIGYMAIFAATCAMSFLGKGDFTVCEVLETSYKNLYHDGICPVRNLPSASNSTAQTTVVTTQNPFHPVSTAKTSTTTVPIAVGEWALEEVADNIESVRK